MEGQITPTHLHIDSEVEPHPSQVSILHRLSLQHTKLQEEHAHYQQRVTLLSLVLTKRDTTLNREDPLHGEEPRHISALVFRIVQILLIPTPSKLGQRLS